MGARLLDENIVLHVQTVVGGAYEDVCSTLSRLIDEKVGSPNPGTHTTCVGGSSRGPSLGMDKVDMRYRSTRPPVSNYGVVLGQNIAECLSTLQDQSRDVQPLDVSAQRPITERFKRCLTEAYRDPDLFDSRLQSSKIPPARGSADRYLTELLDHDEEPVAFITEDLGPDTHTREQVTVIVDHRDLETALRGNLKDGILPPPRPVEAAADLVARRLRRTGLAVGP